MYMCTVNVLIMVLQRTDRPEQSTVGWAHKRPNIAEKWILNVVLPSLGEIKGLVGVICTSMGACKGVPSCSWLLQQGLPAQL
jgi:hypothetical protein